jgi:hypothetical protein
MAEIYVALVDDFNSVIEESKLRKPQNYYELLDSIKDKFKNLPGHFKIFYKSIDNKITAINNNEEYKLSNDILFIRSVEDLNKSIYSLNYNKLSESKRDILDEKYGCFICLEKIKDEKTNHMLSMTKNIS